MTTETHAMIIAAHPDDAEFGAAGTVARWTREGKSVVYVVCTNGDKGTSDPDLSPERLAVIREREQKAAADLLGVKDVVFLGLPDQGLEDTPGFRKELVRLIRKYRPAVIVTTDPYRRYIWHRDHRVVGQVVLDAVFPCARDYHAYPDLAREGYPPHKVKEIWFFGSENPNHYSDITETFPLKLASLKCHDSQVREFNIPDLEQWLRKRYQSTDSAYELAESFHRVETPP